LKLATVLLALKVFELQVSLAPVSHLVDFMGSHYVISESIMSALRVVGVPDLEENVVPCSDFAALN